MRANQPSHLQFCFLTALTLIAIAWLLLLTGLKEYWGFWQSPEVYGFLKTEYPQWMRDYIKDYYPATFCFTLTAFLGWLLFASRDLRAAKCWATFIRRLCLLLLLTALIGAVLGVRFTNNFINLLDSGRLHGITHMQVQE
jgi:hypothetical protein